MNPNPNENVTSAQVPVSNQSPYVYSHTSSYIPVEEPDTEETKNLKKNFGVLGLSCFLYACFYALCMYKNKSAITYPFFLAGSLWFYCFCMKKLEISLKKDSVFYMISILLLGVSTFCTADEKIIAMNKTGVWVLTFSFLLHQFYRDENWTFGRYIGNVITTMFGCLGEIARPFTDMASFAKNRGKNKSGNVFYIVIGLCVGSPLFLIVWLLLGSADMVFMNMTEGLLNMLDIGNLKGIFFTIVIMCFFSYWVMAYLCKKTFSDEKQKKASMEAAIGITVGLPITLLYLVFSGVQIVCLFLGKINLENTTYAEYARQGFFQLLLVCILNLVLVLIGRAYFKENRLLDGVMTAMSFCTYVMIVSSAFRMILYIKHYYLTFLRIFVLWALVVLFVLLTGVIISIYKKGFKLFRYSMVVVTVCYLVLSFSHPDYWIAKCNVANMESAENAGNDFFDADAYRDFSYLSGLSADAAPALKDALEGDWGEYYLDKIEIDYSHMGIRNFNLSKFVAYQILQNY